ncbi:MAG: Gfo/Idh/MocA family oxidoreductase [Verrucomicrobiae bacterium]|nr:Gfo/Idh/MocA family oxidoreductase [Verrucomicrobiae bacterium]
MNETPSLPHVTRRHFLRTTSAALTAPLVVPAGVLGADGRTAPSERIGLGIIGVNGMGQANLQNCAVHQDVVVRGVCDVSRQRREAVVARFKDTATGYNDFRELLARPDIDAVIIATPPHWHALMGIRAVEAGKDIYLQKPMTLHLGESLAVRNAVRKHGRISQIGTQIHAGENYRRVVEFLRAGNLGSIGVVRTFNVMNQGPQGIGRVANTAPPDDLDWDLWCGPAPWRPFHPLLAADAYHHCSWMDYSGGWTPGMAPHIIDLPIWALDLGFPQMVSSSGGRFVVKDDGDAYDHHEVLWRYPNTTLTWMSSLTNSYDFVMRGQVDPARRLGIYFQGSNGTLYSNYDMYRVIPEGNRMDGWEPPAESILPSPGQELEWLESIRSRKQPLCNVDYHVRVDVPVVLSLLSLRLGRSIQFDPEKETIVGDPVAARAAIPEYRAPWKFPEDYLKA